MISGFCAECGARLRTIPGHGVIAGCEHQPATIACWPCRNWAEDHCLISRWGHPKIGPRCQDYEREPGAEG